MPLRAFLMLALASAAFAEGWNPKLAAQYLDGRQKAWFEWPRAKATGGVCISCHTGVPYLLARPALRKALGETSPTAWETGLVDGLRARAGMREPLELSPNGREPDASRKLGVEAILSALFLDGDAGKQAMERLWLLQIREGKERGSWQWFEFDLDPWESPHSQFYGAALAALAAGSGPSKNREPVEALTGYLDRERAAQPLHNRLALAWASSKLPAALDKKSRKAIAEETLSKQQADGGWTLESIGPWKVHEKAAPSAGSNAYATAFAAFTLERAGVKRSHAALAKARAWLRSHQETDGSWAAESMNKRYEAGSIPAGFMRDAATSFAVLALVD